MSTLHVLLPKLSRFDTVPAVQRHLARGDRLEPGGVDEVAASSYFDYPGSTLPVAALLREHLAGDAGDAVWLCADVAHIQPDMTGARMLACGHLDLGTEDADALAAPLRPLFGDSGMRLETTLPSRWHVCLPAQAPLPVFAQPGAVLGDDLVRHLPEGEHGRRWRQLFNEVQILLHQNPVNRQRAQHGQITANSLWFWGGGKQPAWVRSRLKTVYADAPMTTALAARAGVGIQPVNTFDAGQRLPGDGLLDLARASSAQACAEMLFDMLQRRRVDALTLHFSGGERWRITRAQRWRLWRRGA